MHDPENPEVFESTGDEKAVVKEYRLAFKMQLHKGFEEEYKKRHSALWPELNALLKSKGISEYAIFLDKQTNNLFSTMKVADPHLLDGLPSHTVMQKWWDYMKDIMETNADNSPVSTSLQEVFYLP
jgi:L-rhamnose mutarotase